MTCGRPSVSLRTSMLVQAMPRLRPVPSGFQDRLLGSPPAGEMLDGVLPRLAVADLALGVNAAEKQFAMILDHLADSGTLDDIGADPQDDHARCLFGPNVELPGPAPWRRA